MYWKLCSNPIIYISKNKIESLSDDDEKIENVRLLSHQNTYTRGFGRRRYLKFCDMSIPTAYKFFNKPPLVFLIPYLWRLVFIVKTTRISTGILKLKKDFLRIFEESRICHFVTPPLGVAKVRKKIYSYATNYVRN